MLEAFHSYCDAEKVKRYRLTLDVKTRWNSTHAMLSRAVKCRKPLEKLAESGLMKKFKLGLKDLEWLWIEQICVLLKVFHQATEVMSNATYPTLPQTIPIYNHLIDQIEDYLEDRSGKLPGCVDAMKAAHSKILEYYAGQEQLSYICATGKILARSKSLRRQILHAVKYLTPLKIVLDPRLKMEYWRKSGWERSLIMKAKDRFVEEYKNNYRTEDRGKAPATKISFMDEILKRQKTNPNKSELERYLCSSLFDGIDIMSWWKSNTEVFPCLAKMARDYLAIPGTSVPSERRFSASGDMISPKRNRLAADTIRATMCLHDWWKVDYAKETRDWLQTELADDEDEIEDEDAEEADEISPEDSVSQCVM